MGIEESIRDANRGIESSVEMLNSTKETPVAVSIEYPDDKRLYLFLIGQAAVLSGKLIDGEVSSPCLIITASERTPVYRLAGKGFEETHLGWSRQLIIPIAGGTTIAVGNRITELLNNEYSYTGRIPIPIAQAFKT